MGTGGTKAHESFTVSTTAQAPDTDTDTAGTSESGGPDGVDVAAIAGWAPDADDLTGSYQHLADLVADAGTTPEVVDAAGAALEKLPTDQLVELGAANGFAHPTLVGLSETDPHPLAHWLNPAVPPDDPTKDQIAAKAEDRYAQLAGGATINGLTISDVHVAEAALGLQPPPPEGAWIASHDDVVAAHQQLDQALTHLNSLIESPDTTAKTNAIVDVLKAEDHLATAHCPEMGQSLTASKAAARLAVDETLTTHLDLATVGPIVIGAEESGALPAGTATVLNGSEALGLIRASTPKTERDALEATLAARQGLLEAHNQAKHAWDQTEVPDSISGPDGKAALVAYAETTGAFYGIKAEIAPWQPHALQPASGFLFDKYEANDTEQLKSWAKGQTLGDLREVAGTMGLEHAGAASRAEATQYIAGAWDSSINQSTISTSVAAKAAAKAELPTAGAASIPQAGPPAASAPPAGAGGARPAPGTFAAKHLALVESLKHHAASSTALPQRVPAAAVESWEFTPGPAKAVGGAHTKSFHTAPDGSVWMFKPDKTAGGARAHAEAAASDVFARAGVPAVPVYATTINGKTGSIQPLVPKATDLSPSPSGWSQADVDAIVRYHVAAWAVGDHDGKPDNVLRTSGGGLVPIDQGQAFKFYGRDQLSTGYHPNASFGAARPVYHQAYLAAKKGGLSGGVTIRPEAALPVIKSFESISDADYRSLLHKTAHEGAKNGGVHWYDTMRTRAAKRLGTPSPSATQIATEFLDHAVERKNGLRAAFAGFFASEGFTGHHKISKVS